MERTQRHRSSVQLLCVFVFAKADCWFSVAAAEINEPPRGKTNNVVSDQVRHKPTCTVTEKSWKLEISDLSRRGTGLSE